MKKTLLLLALLILLGSCSTTCKVKKEDSLKVYQKLQKEKAFKGYKMNKKERKRVGAL